MPCNSGHNKLQFGCDDCRKLIETWSSDIDYHLSRIKQQIAGLDHHLDHDSVDTSYSRMYDLLDEIEALVEVIKRETEVV